MHQMSLADRRARLGLRHHLQTPAADLTSVCEAMIGLHSSDPATVYLSARARTAGFARADLEAALYDDRTLLRMLGMRRTMFVVTRPVAAIMDAACTQALAPAERRRLMKLITAQGLAGDTDPTTWLGHIEAKVLAALADLGEATAVELTKQVPELSLKIVFGAGKRWGASVGLSTRLLFLMATEASIVRARPRGTWLSSQYRWTALNHWIDGHLDPMEPAQARGELLRRWLRAFGPGTFTDLKWWTGWGVRHTRAALKDIGAVEVALEDSEAGYLMPDDLDPVTSIEPWVALLPGLDPTAMGWKDRDWLYGPHRPQLFDTNGNAGPTIWHSGRVVGGWAQRKTGEVVFETLEDLGREAETAIEAEVARLSDWLGDVVVTPRFRTPLEKRLSAETGP